MVAAPLQPGSVLGRYELLTPIAHGGMGAVWAARQSGLHGFRKTVAVKTLLPSLSEDATFERMFLSEARLVMRMHHPNVAEVLDLGEDQGVLYLVMEWIDGESLSPLIKAVEKAGERIPVRLATYICLKTCLGLHAAHEVTDDDDHPAGIVHRDVSPQNVMVTFEGHVKVVDFGVAKSAIEGAATGTGEFLKGKVPYMAPEQASGGTVDRRTDIFSLGTLLFRLTTGAHPFMGENQIVTLNNVLRCEPQQPRAINPELPVEIEKIILRCMEKDPAARFTDMVDLSRALETALFTMGAAVMEHELASFMKLHLGEQRKARRAAMRDASRALGWAVSTGESLPRISLSGQMEAMTPSTRLHGGALSGHTPSSQRMERSAPSVATMAAVTHSQPVGRPRKTLAMGLMGAITVAAVAGIIVVLAMRSPPPAQTPASAADARSAASVVTASAVPAQPETGPTPTATAADPELIGASASPSASPRAPFGRQPRATATAKPFGSGPDMGF